MGYNAGYNIGLNGYLPSSGNVVIGTNSGTVNRVGNNMVLLGDSSDAYYEIAYSGLGPVPSATPLNNSVALGANAKVNESNQVILGNNEQFVGIGESNDQQYSSIIGPQWNLEISTEHNTAYGLPGLGGGTAVTANTYGGSGFTGLRFPPYPLSCA